MTQAPRSKSGRLSAGLPDFPWDLLEPAKAKASAHPDGIVDLSVGTPVDPVPEVIRQALADAANAPGYPLTAGSPALRAAICEWLFRTTGAAPGFSVLPTIGSKELVAWLPTLLGLGPGDVVGIPSVCYPTYEVGARLAGAAVARTASVFDLDPAVTRLVWLNSPGNPDGSVLTAGDLEAAIEWARANDVVLVSDECYLTLGWDAEPVSILTACAGDYRGVLAVHSLSKRSNLAGYRAGFVAGDPSLVGELLAVRKHVGMIVPQPVQAAMIAALGDDRHAAEQKERYRTRRSVLSLALRAAGFQIASSQAGLYLWATRDGDCWSIVDWLASRGILVAPGSFYGPAGERFVRLALTASDERVGAAVNRLTAG